ncbi:MAG: flagellar motor switch protein FliM [Pyrinomonadaceae bacterium]
MTADKALVTEEEMSVLLKSPNGGAAAGGANRQRVVPYDFRHPNRISKEKIRSLYLLHDMFSHSLSTSVPIFLRAISDITLISVEQQAYVEYIYGLPDPTAIFTIAMRPLQGLAILELGPSIAFPVIDRMLGGAGKPLQETRALTEIEQKILEGFLKLITDDLKESWKQIIELDIQIVGRETRPQLLQIVSPNEVMITIVFHLQIADAVGTMSLSIPATMLEPVMDEFNQSSYTRSRNVIPEQTKSLIENLLSAEFDVTAELHGTSIMMNDLIDLVPGDILRCSQSVTQPVEVRVSGLLKFYGNLVSSNKSLAVQLCGSASALENQ